MRKLFLLPMALLSFSCAIHSSYQQSIKALALKLCFLGDTGVGNENQRAVAQMLAKEKCHSIHFLGDIIYPEGLKSAQDEEFQKKFWSYYGGLTQKDHRPTLYITLGNHDFEGSVRAWKELADAYPKIFFPNPYYFLRLNQNVCLTHLTTHYYGLLGNHIMGRSQSSWMKSLEKELKSCEVKIALAHEPYNAYIEPLSQSMGVLRYFLGKYVIGTYDYYIAGHEHLLADLGTKEGTRLLISGAGGKHKEGHNNGFLVMEIKDGQVTYEFRMLER